MKSTTAADRLRAVPDVTTLVADLLGRRPELGRILQVELHPQTSVRRLCGPARVLVLRPARPGEALSHDPLLAEAEPGCVAVVDAGGYDRGSVLGGRLARLGRAAGITGYLVHGRIRDVEDLEALGLGVWSHGTHPAGARHTLTPAVEVAEADIGGMRIRHGDLVLADPNGVVVIVHDHVDEVLHLVLEAHRAEEAALAHANSGAVDEVGYGSSSAGRAR